MKLHQFITNDLVEPFGTMRYVGNNALLEWDSQRSKMIHPLQIRFIIEVFCTDDHKDRNPGTFCLISILTGKVPGIVRWLEYYAFALLTVVF